VWYNRGMKPKPYQVVVEWQEVNQSYYQRWDTFQTRKEAVAKLRELATNPNNANLKVIEYWTASQAVEAR